MAPIEAPTSEKKKKRKKSQSADTSAVEEDTTADLDGKCSQAAENM